MPLQPGARLGPYRVEAEIGAGGMGHVFRATDTRLDRKVAIKVLPQHRWTDPQVRLRFEREARALSSLSHPHLCALYDVGELTQSGATVPYLVMELLEGETLRERLENRLNMRKALLWGAQIAEGLAAAHAKGVIHRDLKPENVFITEGELLKILDFGLATTAPMGGDSTTAVRTEPGVVMGTAHYMSPEQVRGSPPLDARSDIFSLGIVLFEMITGSVPFRARSVVETMNSILVDDPPDLPGVPDAVETIVRRCLEKDPSQRFASAKDLAFALESAAKNVHTSAKATLPIKRGEGQGEGRKTKIAILTLIALGIAAAAYLSRDTKAPEPPSLRTLTWSGRDTSPAASPDGKLIAYISERDGTRRIWLEQLADGTEAPVTSGPDDSAPRFSPDGASLLFTRAGALYRVGVVGGDPRKLIDNAFDGDWSPDGTRIAFIRTRATAGRESTLCVASLDGGAVRELASSADVELTAPRWSPDQSWIALNVRPRGTTSGSILLVNVESGERRTLSRKEPHGLLSGAAWTRSGDAVVYAELEGLASVGLPRRRGSSVLVRHEIDGDRARVLLRNPHSGADTVDIAPGGRIVFTEDVTRQSLEEVTLGGTGSRWLSRGMSVDRQPAYARGGTSIVFASDRGGNVDLWEVTLDSGRVRRLTDHPSVDWDPKPAADALVWSSNRGGHFEIWSASMDGAGAHQVTRDGVDAENPSLPAADDWIYYDSTNPKHDGLWRVTRGGTNAEMVVAGETVHPNVSADGQYVVYQVPGEPSAVRVVRGSDRKVFTLAAGIYGVNAVRAQWIGTSHTVAFRAFDATGRVAVFAQEFVPDVDTTSTRRPLIVAEAETFAISPDGTHAVLSLIDEASGIMMAEGVDGLE